MPTKKFLVIQQKMIGDVLASTVICEKLRDLYPKSIIHFIANENTLPVLTNNPNIDKIIVFEKKYRTSKKAFLFFLNSIKKEPYFAVVDAYGKLESNLISLFAKADYKTALYKWYTQWIYSHTVEENLTPKPNIPLSIENRLRLVHPLSTEKKERYYHPKIYLTENEKLIAKNKIASLTKIVGKQIIMVSILGSNNQKTYPAEFMAKTLDFVSDNTDALLLFNYIPHQKKEAYNIYEKCSVKTQSRIEIDFYADSLRNFIAILSQCSLLIGNEGGAVNMAKALDIPTFCIFSPFIIKGAWHTENSQKHRSVHLKDYKPELFNKRSKKEVKKSTPALYNNFEPHLFTTPLHNFLKHHCSK